MQSSRSAATPPDYSIAVPFHNEEGGIEPFFERLVPILEQLDGTYEIVCVDDGSSDGTLAALLEAQQGNPAIVVLELSRNFGKEAALTAALDHALGRAVIPIDADLQDPPELIPRMVTAWKEGYDVVFAQRTTRKSDTIAKQWTATWFYRAFNAISDISLPANVGDFRLMDRRVVNALQRLGERNRFMKGLFAWVGFRHTSVSFDREPRITGRSKWNYWKLWNFAIDGFLAFSSAPLRIWSYMGACVSLVAFCYASFLILRTLFFGVDVPGYASIMVVVLFLGGVQLIGLGVMGEYLGRVFEEVKQRPVYLIRERHRVE